MSELLPISPAVTQRALVGRSGGAPDDRFDSPILCAYACLSVRVSALLD